MSGIVRPDSARRHRGFAKGLVDQPATCAPWLASVEPNQLRLCAIWRAGSIRFPAGPAARKDPRGYRSGARRCAPLADIRRDNFRHSAAMIPAHRAQGLLAAKTEWNCCIAGLRGHRAIAFAARTLCHATRMRRVRPKPKTRSQMHSK